MLPVRVTRNWPSLHWRDDLFAPFAREFGRVFDTVSESTCSPLRGIDVREDDDHLHIEAEVPGLTAADVEITLEDGLLTLKGERKTESETEEGHYHIRERSRGQFVRAFQLPVTVDEDSVTATLRDGVLTVTLNKAEKAKVRRIEVEGA